MEFERNKSQQNEQKIQSKRLIYRQRRRQLGKYERYFVGNYKE